MPWQVKQTVRDWQVVNKETGKVMGHHPSRERAMAQMRALYAHQPMKEAAHK